MRFIELEGCFNFRDLGGYATAAGGLLRWGQVYRSDALHHLTGSDVTRLREQIGLATVIDLRSEGELASCGRGPLARAAVQFHHIPLSGGQTTAIGVPYEIDATQADRYVVLADWARAQIARVIEAVAVSEGPAVFHCAAGKDRTGVVAAIVLGAVGVNDDEIVADYALTTAMLPQILDRLATTPGYHTTLQALPADMLDAQPTTMADFLIKMRDRYGSLRGYALAAGVSPRTLELLQQRLLGE